MSLGPKAQQKLRKNHPWLTGDDVGRSLISSRHPAIVCLAGRWWFYSPKSFIKFRRIGPIEKGRDGFPKADLGDGKAMDAGRFQQVFGEWFRNHALNLLRQKTAALHMSPEETPCLRWIFSENDYLPGVIVDIFGATIVAQINSAAVEVIWFRLKDMLIEVYHEHFKVKPQVVELRTASSRIKEGLDIIQPEGDPTPQILNWNGLKWWMTPGSSQKTGAYFDQRMNHLEAAQLAKAADSKVAWDLCAYQGGFTLQLLKAGVPKVTAVDQSAEALETLKQNCDLNHFGADRVDVVKADIFEFLKNSKEAGRKADFIILDPPSFVRDRKSIPAAIAALKEINQLAMGCLNPGGILVSCVCSHHVGEAAFSELLAKASVKAERTFQIEKITGPSADHAPLKEFPEGRYLQAAFLRFS